MLAIDAHVGEPFGRRIPEREHGAQGRVRFAGGARHCAARVSVTFTTAAVSLIG